MVKFFKCLQCDKEFPQKSYTGVGKFCKDACYKEYRKIHGSKSTYAAEPIFLYEKDNRIKVEKKSRRGRPPVKKDALPPEPQQDASTADRTDIEPQAIVDNDQPQDTPVNGSNGDAERIDFEDLSLNDLRSVISQLLEQNEEHVRMIEDLNIEISRLAAVIFEEQPSDKLTVLVHNFVKNVQELEKPQESIQEPQEPVPHGPEPEPLPEFHCPSCNTPFIPSVEGQTFCTQGCTEKFMSKSHGVMALHDGTLIGGKNNHGGK
jgi:hypothetical protein